jgi:hypothetical protein
MKEGFSRRRSASKKTGGIGRCRLAHLQSCAEQLRSLFARNSSLSCVPVQFSKLFSRLPPVKDHRPSRSITLPKCANNSNAKINFKKKTQMPKYQVANWLRCVFLFPSEMHVDVPPNGARLSDRGADGGSSRHLQLASHML